MVGRAAPAAVVLAGGQSRRMGRDKAVMAHPGRSGRSMVENTVAVLTACCDPIIVVAAPGQVLPPLNARILRDEVPGAGPLPATALGLRAAADAGAQRAFVSAVDMPHLSSDLVGILDAYQGFDIVIPRDDRDHFLAGVYRTDLADRIDALVAAGARSMRALADTVAVERVAVPDPVVLTNLNFPSDLR